MGTAIRNVNTKGWNYYCHFQATLEAKTTKGTSTIKV